MNGTGHRISSMRTVGTFLRTGTCSETLFSVLNRTHGRPMNAEERASGPLAGGIVMHGYQCGQVWGAALSAGALAYRSFGAGARAQAKAIVAAQRAVAAFRAQNHAVDCFDIMEVSDKSSKLQLIGRVLLKGGPLHCFTMAARYAPVACQEIGAALTEPTGEGTSPASCASVVAEKMGASEEHATMVAGLAGGIGLSGGGCGALGAAVWLTALKCLDEGKPPNKAPEVAAVVDRFLKCTNYEFECAAIVGRRFESVADHAGHLCQGGCSKILECLASGRGAT